MSKKILTFMITFIISFIVISILIKINQFNFISYICGSIIQVLAIIITFKLENIE